uniref:small monomeric GTPase n=2 Tax=Gasterosteus aculeatus aculeatus TaxID=481459 RepID=G3Q755_GASAC
MPAKGLKYKKMSVLWTARALCLGAVALSLVAELLVRLLRPGAESPTAARPTRLSGSGGRLRDGRRRRTHKPQDEMALARDPAAAAEQRDAADQNFDYMFKLLIIGNSSVGKTSFLFRFADDSFTSAFVSTVGIDFKVKTIYRSDKRVKLQIWDTAGQERYRTITTAYYRGAMGFLLMYDITSQESFCAVQDWATQIKTYSWGNAQVVLVGNKLDLEEDRQVPTEDAQRLATELGFQFFEASAKDNVNVKQVFDELVDVICERMNESVNGDATPLANHDEAGLKETPRSGLAGCGC